MPRKRDPEKAPRKVGRDSIRTYRCPDDLYEKVKTYTQEDGRSVSDVIREAFEAYVAKRERALARAAARSAAPQ